MTFLCSHSSMSQMQHIDVFKVTLLMLQFWVNCTCDWTPNAIIEMIIIYELFWIKSRISASEGERSTPSSAELWWFSVCFQTFPLVRVSVVYGYALSDLNSCQAINRTVWRRGEEVGIWPSGYGVWIKLTKHTQSYWMNTFHTMMWMQY